MFVAMEWDKLLEQYQSDERVNKVITHVRSNNRSVFNLQGLSCSAVGFVVHAVFKQTKSNHVFILDDKESAAYFQNDLKVLFEKKDILFFPDSFKTPGNFSNANSSNILLRTESVNRFIHAETKGEILVTYPEAIFEQVVNKKALDKNTLYIVKNDKLDVDFLIDAFIEYGFERTDFVFEPGQFSIRGGIVDIFSFGNDLPYRVELFDDEVESIRTFDPLTQESQKKIAKVTIMPNIQSQFTIEEKADFFSVLPSNTIVWMNESQFIFEQWQALGEKLKKWQETVEDAIIENPEHPLKPENGAYPITYAAQIEKSLPNFTLIQWGNKHLYESDLSALFTIKPQPPFNKNFQMLIDNLKEKEGEGMTTFLFADNVKQITRFSNIFEDLQADVTLHPVLKSLYAGFIDEDLKLVCYTDHQIFDRYHKYSIKQSYGKSQALSLKVLRDLTPGDFVTHIDHGVGMFSGLEKIEVNGNVQEAVRLVYRDSDLLYVSVHSLHKISKFSGKDGTPPSVNKLGTDAWSAVKRKAKKKIKDIARDLIKLYAKRKASKGFSFSPDTYLQTELEASFIYEDTPDQEQATIDVKEDMESENPMDRLICGDVGFGKTEIAIRAAFKAVTEGKQVAILVPTTILAMQHHRTFTKRLKEFGCEIDYINRFKTAKEKKETLAKLAEGKVDILIGTHGIVGKQVKFKDLGLLIVDEEQKFGVAVKEKLKAFKANVDTLMLTATPIPRTLQFSLMGARDLSVIRTAPPNRQPINTELHVFSDEVLRDAIHYEYYRGGQVFFIHNRVSDIAEMAAMIKRLCPEVEVGMAHGQMEGKQLEAAMMSFINRRYDVLVSTNIIETGLDIPNANTIIISQAQNFGLSDLHQLRGRVGRSNKKAFCYLFCPPLTTLSTDARKRLSTIEQFADLGSGFDIAMKDLDIRGAGNLLGGEQSGFIADIGFETYQKILDEAVQELRNTDFKELFADQPRTNLAYVSDCTIDTDLEILIPDNYVSNINERLSLYTQLNGLKDVEELERFAQKLRDRFGPIPLPTEELFNAVQLQWVAKQLAFEKIVFKNGVFRGFFVSNKQSVFYESPLFTAILTYVQKHPARCQLKETGKHLILTIKSIRNIKESIETLKKIAGVIV